MKQRLIYSAQQHEKKVILCREGSGTRCRDHPYPSNILLSFRPETVADGGATTAVIGNDA
jgi:hypothetical protein